ncbi:MAG: CAAX prenyl protease-related protein [Acidobacteriota bacterium]
MRAHAEVAGSAVALTGPTFDGAPLRIAALAGLLVVEMLAMTTWLDTRSLDAGTGLVYLIAHSGAVVLRIAIAAAVLSLVFGTATASGARRLPAWHAPAPDNTRFWLATHFLIAGIFAAVSYLLFQGRLPALDELLAAAWLLTGAAVVTSAAFILLPPRAWAQLLRIRRTMLLGAVAVAGAAAGLGWLATILWQPMSRATLLVAFTMLQPFVPTVTADPSTFRLGTPEFSVLVSRECSGAEGLGLMLAFTVTWLWLHRAEWRFPRALLLVPIGLSLVWLFNCLRIAGLVLIGAEGAPEIALGGFHSQAGWLGFNAAAIGICLAARRLPWLTVSSDGRRAKRLAGCPRDGLKSVPYEKNAASGFRQTMTSTVPDVQFGASGFSRTVISELGDVKAASAATTSNPTATYLMPFLALLAGGMVSGLGTGTFEWLYAIRVAAVGAVLWSWRRSYREIDWRIGWGSIGLGVIVFAIWLALEPLVGSGAAGMPAALTQAGDGGRNTWLALRVLGAVVAVPIAEELAFRGYLLRRFVREDFERVDRATVTSLAIIVSSLAFGILHGERWLAGAIAGLVYAAAYLRRGSIGDAVAAHATTNALIAAAVLGAGLWHLW